MTRMKTEGKGKSQDPYIICICREVHGEQIVTKFCRLRDDVDMIILVFIN